MVQRSDDNGDLRRVAERDIRAQGSFNDARMEALMGRLLQTGVLLAASVVLGGGLLYVSTHASARTNYRTFAAEPIALRHPAALLKGIAHGDPLAIVAFGILLLVATPICRVISGVIAFAMERDRLYAAVSMVVLAVLLFGILRGT